MSHITFSKALELTHFINFILLWTFCFSLSLFAETDYLQIAKSYVHRKQFTETLMVCTAYLEQTKKIEPNDELLRLYIATETDVHKIDKMLKKVYQNSKQNPPDSFYDLIYIYMEKALIAEEYKESTHWGKLFKDKAKHSKLYTKGMYLYSLIIHSQKKNNDATSIIENIQSKSKSKKLRVKFLLLKNQHRKGSNKTIYEMEAFMRVHRKFKYKDFLVYSLIEAYKQNGNKQKARKLMKLFMNEYPASIHFTKIKKLSEQSS